MSPITAFFTLIQRDLDADAATMPSIALLPVLAILFASTIADELHSPGMHAPDMHAPGTYAPGAPDMHAPAEPSAPHAPAESISPHAPAEPISPHVPADQSAPHDPAEPSAPVVHQQQVELPALPEARQRGFGAPFRQYEGGALPGWSYGGDAALFNDYIALTPAAPQKTGWIFQEQPSVVGGWEAELVFHIGGVAKRGPGGGMAFWWTAEPAKNGPIYGHSDRFLGLGLFFDTYEIKRGRSPPVYESYVVAIANDGRQIAGLGEELFDLQVIAPDGFLLRLMVSGCF